MKDANVRLLEGQIPLYAFDGEVVAYLYIGLTDTGPLPTISEIISKARDIGDDRDRFRKENYGKPLRGFYAEFFPYGNTSGHGIEGVSPKCPIGFSRGAIPEFIYRQYKAEDAARWFYGFNYFELVRYLLAPTTGGYEFTDGRENVVVPFDLLSGRVSVDNVLTREEVDANIEKYRFTFDPERARKWVEQWKRQLKITGSNADYDAAPAEQ